MKTLALAAFCAILSQCHARESTLSRPKRTLRILESLFGSMRDTFGPLTAPLPAPQPPSEMILATKYPVGVKYALYPTVRMHIRPVQQHVIYMQSIPAPVLRPVRPLNAGAVEILRPMAAPMVRVPKTQTTTTIHYEIIPVPVPVPIHSEPPAPAFSMAQSPPPPPPPPPSVSSFSYDETDDPSAPWSLDELPPPVPTSAPLNPLDEPNVPWNLHALPPPVATKQPRGNEAFGWPLRSSAHQHGVDGRYALPAIFDKKLVIPAQGTGSHNRQRGIFRPSQLQSEISIQPSVEVAAYSETHTLAHQPAEYANRLRNLNSPRPQVFPSRNNRLRREAPPAVLRPKQNHPQPPSRPMRPNMADSHSQNSPARQLAPTIGHDIRLSPSLFETSPPERYVLVTPRPVHYSRRSQADPAPVETRQNGYARTSDPRPRSSNLLRGSAFDQGLRPRDRDQFAALLGRTEGLVRFPPTGSLSKAVRSQQQQRPSLFSSSNKSPPLSVDNFFDDRPTESPTSAAKSRDQFWRSDYDNVEYFEPIIIDIGDDDDDDDEKRRRTDFGGPRVEFKPNNLELKKSTRREPLRLPGRLHETVDRLSEALMHPPIFDVESEANEPRAVIVLLGNEIT